AVRLAEFQLSRRHRERLEQLRQSAQQTLATVRGPVLVVDDEGWVAHRCGVAVGSRVAAPRAAVPLHVPGLGLCVPERLTNGWLVRPRPAGNLITARLDLSGEPVLDIMAEDDSWRTPLTRRHAQILQLLAEAGWRGLSAAQLSTALYGDSAHVVTVRAEVSRMRRVLGALVTANPYRLSAEVDLTVRMGDLPHVSAERPRLNSTGTQASG
ncbi:MAG: transcriptional regulator, partial [Ornithinimicrobium sp.]